MYGKIHRVDHERAVTDLNGSTFFEFASACVYPEGRQSETLQKLPIYFSDSSRTRKDVVVHVYKPLLADIFSFNVVYSIFEMLGIRKDCKCK